MFGASVGNGLGESAGGGAGRQPPPWKGGAGPAAMIERSP